MNILKRTCLVSIADEIKGTFDAYNYSNVSSARSNHYFIIKKFKRFLSNVVSFVVSLEIGSYFGVTNLK
jgi:hypothetical protein